MQQSDINDYKQCKEQCNKCKVICKLNKIDLHPDNKNLTVEKLNIELSRHGHKKSHQTKLSSGNIKNRNRTEGIKELLNHYYKYH